MFINDIFRSSSIYNNQAHELQDNIKEDLIFNLQKYNIKHKKHPPQFL